jgi:hypothetical protein
MTTFFLSCTLGAGPFGPTNNTNVVEGTSTVSTAAVQVEINTTAAPGLGYGDALSMLEAIKNYIETDASLTAASRVLALLVP